MSYRFGAVGEPSGDANLRVRGLTRSGLVLSSRPVDIGVVAKLAGGNAALRAVAVSEGRTIGRAQARLAPIGRSGNIGERLSVAPLFAQLRYNGPADTLWRLTGVELLDVSGPVAVGADARGTLNNPQIRGSLRTERARIESAVTGMVIENVRAAGRFGGSKLVLDSFAGTTKRGGTVSGRATFDLAGPKGFGIDIALQAQAAQLLDRDDIKAQVTGPLADPLRRRERQHLRQGRPGQRQLPARRASPPRPRCPASPCASSTGPPTSGRSPGGSRPGGSTSTSTPATG